MHVLDELNEFHKVISWFLIDMYLNMQDLICEFVFIDE